MIRENFSLVTLPFHISSPGLSEVLLPLLSFGPEPFGHFFPALCFDLCFGLLLFLVVQMAFFFLFGGLILFGRYLQIIEAMAIAVKKMFAKNLTHRSFLEWVKLTHSKLITQFFFNRWLKLVTPNEQSWTPKLDFQMKVWVHIKCPSFLSKQALTKDWLGWPLPCEKIEAYYSPWPCLIEVWSLPERPLWFVPSWSRSSRQGSVSDAGRIRLTYHSEISLNLADSHYDWLYPLK